MPTIDVHGVEYFYRDEGSGPAVILGHSDASSSAQWRGLIETLHGEFRLLAFDISGQGRSAPWPAQRPYSCAADSAIVDALAGLAPGPLHLVGHSAGGMIVLDAALRLAGRLASLTLAEPTVFQLLRMEGRTAAWEDIDGVATAFQQGVAAGRQEETMARFVEYWTQPGGWEAIPAERRQSLVTAADKIALEWAVRQDEEPTAARLATLTPPTLLIRGELTTLAARTVVEVLHEIWPHARLEEIPGAGHMAPVTHPEPVNAHIAAHLHRHRA